MALVQARYDELPGWRDGHQGGALPALRRSCDRLAARPDDAPLGPSGVGGRAGDWRAACGALAALADDGGEAARNYFERWFHPFRVVDTTAEDGGGVGRFTGYYEIELSGSRSQGDGYNVPLYARPPDLVQVDLGRFDSDLAGRHVSGKVENGILVPYATRATIEDPASGWRGRSRAKVLFWAADPVDAFFLQIQGSGRVVMRSGGTMRVGYAADNGRDFVAIGRLMRKRKLIGPDEASAQGVQRWLRAHPGQATELMRENPRYVFFRKITGDGPVGAAGVVLTPGRSIAVDPTFIPYGTPIWLDTSRPGSETSPFRRLVVAQDRGGAIKGPMRGDLFWGTGEKALEQAGPMNQPGHWYLLLPRRPST